MDYITYRQDKQSWKNKNFIQKIHNKFDFEKIYDLHGFIEKLFSYNLSQTKILTGSFKVKTNGEFSGTNFVKFSIFDFENKKIPPFKLNTENMFTKFINKFTQNEINFNNNKLFSDRFNLVSENKNVGIIVADYFNKYDLTINFSQLTTNLNIHIICKNNKILFYEYGEMNSEKEITIFVNKTKQIFDIFNFDN